MGQAKVARRRSGSSEKKHPSRGMMKKKEARNSIGKTRQKKGSAAKYMTRTKALKVLQLSLKEFRRLCILKGIYPRDPPKKFKGGDKTYYYIKDILYLQHEPLLAKFRDMSALLKKVTRRAGRGEKEDAVRLYEERPRYRLDHLIRERYPTFPDALRDLDDALCLVHLFACVPSAKRLNPERVANCARLCREFQVRARSATGMGRHMGGPVTARAWHHGETLVGPRSLAHAGARGIRSAVTIASTILTPLV